MLVSKKELINLKLNSIKVNELKELVESLGIDPKGKTSDLVKRLINAPEKKIDDFIKRKYSACYHIRTYGARQKKEGYKYSNGKCTFWRGNF